MDLEPYFTLKSTWSTVKFCHLFKYSSHQWQYLKKSKIGRSWLVGCMIIAERNDLNKWLSEDMILHFSSLNLTIFRVPWYLHLLASEPSLWDSVDKDLFIFFFYYHSSRILAAHDQVGSALTAWIIVQSCFHCLHTSERHLGLAAPSQMCSWCMISFLQASLIWEGYYLRWES